MPHSPQSHTTKIKVARITPRPYPEIASSTSSSSKTNSKAIFRPTAAGSSALSVSNSNPQPQLLPNVTLSAVTPSSIKSIPPSVVSAQVGKLFIFYFIHMIVYQFMLLVTFATYIAMVNIYLNPFFLILLKLYIYVEK